MPHQIDGVRFVLQSYKRHGGAIIADEMGLGKTAQACACIELLRTSHATVQQPDLIICPVSVLPTWKTEIERFAPSARVWQYHGQDRQWPTDAQYNAVLTTYEVSNFRGNSFVKAPYVAQIAFADAEYLADKRFRQVILDEAQRLKNAMSATARAIAPVIVSERPKSHLPFAATSCSHASAYRYAHTKQSQRAVRVIGTCGAQRIQASSGRKR